MMRHITVKCLVSGYTDPPLHIAFIRSRCVIAHMQKHTPFGFKFILLLFSANNITKHGQKIKVTQYSFFFKFFPKSK